MVNFISRIGLAGLLIGALTSGCNNKIDLNSKLTNTKIAYVSGRDNDSEIYITRADGNGEERRLTDNGVLDNDPDWSPDGKQIVFVSKRDDERGEIYSMNSHGKDIKRLTFNEREDSDPAWSPDGKKIAYTSIIRKSKGIHLMNSDGSDDKRLTSGFESNSDPTWSPDGKKIAYTSGNRLTSIHVLDLSDNSSKRITRVSWVRNSRHYKAAWSPLDNEIAYTSYQDYTGRGISFSNPEGNKNRGFMHNRSESEPDWSPDGTMVAFVSSQDGGCGVYVMDVKNHKIQRLTSTDNNHSPAWSPLLE